MRNAIGLGFLVVVLAACGGASAEGHVNSGNEPAAGSDRAMENRGWEKLGEREVDGKVDHDVIEVGRADGKFHAVMIDAKGSSMELFDMIITFGDGEKFEPKTRLVFDANTRSREIELPGGNRIIKRVDFKYGNLPGGGRAHVELFGK